MEKNSMLYDSQFQTGAQAQQLAPADPAAGKAAGEQIPDPSETLFSSLTAASAPQPSTPGSANRHTKLFSVISYLTWFCWIAAFLFHDKEDKMVRHHLNQALVVNVLESIGTILARRGGLLGLAGGLIDLSVLVFVIMGIYRAAKLSDEPLPLIGDIKLL